MSMTQKEAVYSSVKGLLTEKKVAHEDGDEVKLGKDDRAIVIGMLMIATENGQVEVKSEKAHSNLRLYWNGCLSNWLRKDTRLNGGDKYETKAPGSRPKGDKKLKALEMLLAKVNEAGDEANVGAVEAAIEVRKAEIAKENAVEIDVDLIPEALRGLLG